jgi:hypothetical protein
MAASANIPPWPALPLDAWKDTYETLHRWVQIVGKVRLAQSPWLNHSWHATLYVTARGLTTGPIRHTVDTFEINFDFLEHQLIVRACSGQTRTVALRPQSVAAFYRSVMSALGDLGVPVKIYARPNELPDVLPFTDDDTHAAYDADAVQRYWRLLVQADRVFTAFRARFQGKCSPVHLFWGALDLAVTRFSGRLAPQHPGGVPHLPDWVARDAYSHEVSSAGFWPGGQGVPHAAFYSYAYPEPDGYRDATVRPSQAYYHPDLREFILPYDAVRMATDPEATLLEFLQDTYEAAANLGRWDRSALERPNNARPLPP